MPGSPYTCCLCGSEEFGYGNNPDPLGKLPKRCCDVCNYTKVIPARLDLIWDRDSVSKKKRGFSSEDSQEQAAAAIVGGIFTVSMGALLEHLGTALNNKDASAATFFKDCIDFMAMSMVSAYEDNTKNFPKEVKYAIDMTLGMTAKQLNEWEQDPAFEELTNLGSSENPDVDTMSEVVLDDAKDGYDDDFSVMYSSEDEPDCDHGTTDMSGRCLHCTMTEADQMNEREGGGWEDCPTCGVAIKVGSNSCRNCSEEKEVWVVELANRDGFRDAEFLGSQDDAQAYHDWVFEQDAGMTPWEITHIKDEQVLTLAKAKERFTQLYVLDDDEGGALQKPVIDYSTRWDGHGDPPEGYDAEELDYEDVENQAVMFDIINMIESNDLWNEIVFELISRGDAVRRPDGKIIFTDQAPQYDIIEDIAEYTSPQFEFNADGDIK